jgi:predicted secreted protein
MRVKTMALILTVMTLLVALGGCSLLGLGPEPVPVPQPVTVVTPPAPPLEINMTGTVGNPFVVVLPGNTSTGHRWEVEHNPAAITLLDEEYVAKTAAPGSDGKFRFTFEPQRTGDITMIFRYLGPGDTEAITTVIYRAKVS